MVYKQSSSRSGSNSSHNQEFEGKEEVLSTNKSKCCDKPSSTSKELEEARVLITESNLEILSLFKIYLEAKGLKSVTVDSGGKALDIFHNSKMNSKGYQTIVLDMHLKDFCGLDVAKKIINENPHQKVLMVTFCPKEQISNHKIKFAKVKEKDILTIPFNLSHFVNTILK